MQPFIRKRAIATVSVMSDSLSSSPVGRVLAVVVDCRDPWETSKFWMAMVGGRVDMRNADDDWVALADVPKFGYLAFQRVPEEKIVKNRVHLDVDVNEIGVAADLALLMGATRRGDVVDEVTNLFQVMEDPGGNEFCLVERRNRTSVAPLTGHPWSQADVAASLRSLGLGTGDVVVLHSSLSSLGYVVGGAQAVIDAFLDVLGEGGTLTMPAHSSDWSDPAGWVAPPVPEAWWPVIRDTTPAFDRFATPPTQMGAIAESFLMRRETHRSSHPRLSHMALGARADEVTALHELDEGLGMASPLGRLFDLDAKVVLLGVGHDRNTSLHLAETVAGWPGKRRVEQGGRVRVGNVSRWVTYSEIDYDTDDFLEVGSAFEATGAVHVGTVGDSTARVMSMRELVEFAVAWFEVNRS